MTDVLLWREERDLRPRMKEDVKDAPYFFPGEHIFVVREDGTHEYNARQRKWLTRRERDEMFAHYTGQPRGWEDRYNRDTSVPVAARFERCNLGLGGDFPCGYSQPCATCDRGETRNNLAAREDYERTERLSLIAWDERFLRQREWHRSQMGAVDRVLRVYGWCLYCVRTDEHHAWRRDTLPGHECAFSAMPVDEFNRRRGGA